MLPPSIDPRLLDDPGYTPSRGDISRVLPLLSLPDEKLAMRAVRALSRAGPAAARSAVKELSSTPPAGRRRIVRLLSLLARKFPEDHLVEALIACSDDQDLRVRRNAIVALGKLRGDRAEARLIELWSDSPELLRPTLVEALGKIGSARALALLNQDQKLKSCVPHLVDRARLMAERRSTRSDRPARARLDVPLGAPMLIAVTCRSGLASVVAEQLRGVDRLVVDAPDRLLVRSYRGTLGELLCARSALAPGLLLALDEIGTGEAMPAALAARLADPDLLDCLERLTEGTPSLRLDVAGTGHQRTLVWSTAQALRRLTSRISLDPVAAPWVATLYQGNRHPWLLILPQRHDDTRFTYRRRQLPAASHPTIAAALAHVLGCRDDDVVWDPFAGSGLELIERARLGPYRALIGSDIDHRAIRAAHDNAVAAGVERLRLEPWDVRTASPGTVTAIVTNPPLGVRLVRDGTLGDLLEAFLSRARQALVPDGRLVWLSPMPERTARYAERLGFSVERKSHVDVGGLKPELQCLRMPHRLVRRRRRKSE